MLDADIIDPIAIVDVHVEPHAILFGQRDTLNVEEGGMLDGPDAGPDRRLDPFGAMGMGNTIGAVGPGLVAGRLHLLGREFVEPGDAADGEHRACGDQLDEISAVVEKEAGAVARFRWIAYFTHPKLFGHRHVGSERVDLASPARNGDVPARDKHPRPLHLAGVDRIPQRDVGKAAIDANVAHRGEAGAKLNACSFRPLEDGVGLAVLQRSGGIAAVAVDRAVGKMGVKVDQAGQNRLARPIDSCRAVGVTPRRDRGCLAVHDPDTLVGENLCFLGVNQSAGADVQGLRCRGRPERQEQRGQ